LLWDKRIIASFPNKAVDLELLWLFQQIGLSLYRRNLHRSFVTYLWYYYPTRWNLYLQGQCSTTKRGGEDEFFSILKAGVDVLKRADRASWFEWKDSSALVFWHWHDFMREARDGFPTQFLENQLRWTPKKVYPPSIPKDHKVKALIEDKLNRILQVRYLLRGYVH